MICRFVAYDTCASAIWSLVRRSLFVVAAVLAIVSLGAPIVSGADEQREVGLIRVDGAITPVMATYIGRGIDRAAHRGDTAVILEMDTPGGLSSAMDDIVSDVLNAPIPVIVYVAPNGARAASAGVYITYAAHIAAMAPATNIGSATPIQVGQTSDPNNLSTEERKIINDAAAKIRALAEQRGRNADWAEQAVRDAANIQASKAVELGVVNFIATDREQVLQQADGMNVTVNGQQVTVQTAGATIDEVNMSFFEQLLQVITDPNIAYILLSLGALGIVFEIASPGGIGPGAIGAILLVAGFYGLGTLDTNWAGLALMGLAFVLFVMDVYLPTHGALTLTGVAAFLFGSLLLANTRDANVLHISRWAIFTMTALLALFFFFIVGSVVRVRKNPPATGLQSIVGGVAIARTDIDPSGMVYMQGELWQAVTTGAIVEKGERVRVVTIEGLTLTVEPLTLEAGSSEAVSPNPSVPG
jgi:membrane-bound serine protease (ClpP class)